jgi:hypothetical protein
MNYLKYTQYIFFWSVFYFTGITKLSDPSGTFWLSFMIAGLAILCFSLDVNLPKNLRIETKNLVNGN